jgi:deoxycytidylate deaminase
MISIGSNRMHYGLPQRFEKEMPENLRVTLPRPEKYASLTHAERDAIYYASRVGIGHMLREATLYTTWTPCVTCAEVIINAGIKRVVTHRYCDDWYSQKMNSAQRVDWDKSIKSALSLMERCGVEYECLEMPISGIEINFDDKIRKT